MLTIKNARFSVVEAKLSAILPDPYWVETYNAAGSKDLYWLLHVLCKSTDERILDGTGVNLTHENIRLPVRSWRALEGQTVAWNEPYDEDGECYGSTSALEDEPMPQGEIRFGARRGLRYAIHWSGLCNTGWDDEYGDNLPLQLTAEALFEGVTVHASERDSEESVLQRISRYLIPDEFEVGPLEPQPNAYQSGFRMARLRMRPIDDTR